MGAGWQLHHNHPTAGLQDVHRAELRGTACHWLTVVELLLFHAHSMPPTWGCLCLPPGSWQCPRKAVCNEVAFVVHGKTERLPFPVLQPC